jgi:hypothetical protein
MRPAYPPDREQDFLDETQLGDDDFASDECSDGVTSLLEENARLRGLVVKLTDIILKTVVDRG